MNEKLHSLLLRQIKKHLSDLNQMPEPLLKNLEKFFEAINESYVGFEEDKMLLDRSMELSSNELVETNHEMRKITAQFQSIFDNAAVGILAVNKDRKYVLSNSKAQKMLGYLEKDLMQKSVEDITHPSDRQEGLDKEKEANYSLMKRYIKSDGSIMWGRITVSALKNSNSQLVSVGILEDITAQREAELLIRKQQIQIQTSAIENAHAAGMSQIATSILHNTGNVLNSVNVGIETISNLLETSVTANLHNANKLLTQNRNRIVDFFTNDPKGLKLIDFYIELGDAVKEEMAQYKREITELEKKVQMIKDIISTQQTYAKGKNEAKEQSSLVELVENALTVLSGSMDNQKIKIIKDYSCNPFILCQKVKLVQVILNLLKNSKEALQEVSDREKVMKLEIGTTPKGIYFLRITDNGIGIEKGNLSTIFNHGFTTKKTGHGFGLHFCANAMTEMGSKISVESEGLNKGTSFLLEFNIDEAEQKAS